MARIARFFSDRRRVAAAVVGLIVVIGAGIGAVALTAPGGSERLFIKASRSTPSPAASTALITVPPADPVAPPASAPPAGPTNGQPGGPAPSEPVVEPAEIVIVCESTVVDENGYETSSSYAYRAPAGTPIPPGCRQG